MFTCTSCAARHFISAHPRAAARQAPDRAVGHGKQAAAGQTWELKESSTNLDRIYV